MMVCVQLSFFTTQSWWVGLKKPQSNETHAHPYAHPYWFNQSSSFSLLSHLIIIPKSDKMMINIINIILIVKVFFLFLFSFLITPYDRLSHVGFYFLQM